MTWKSNTKRFLVMLLVLSMMTGLVPVNVFAASGDPAEPEAMGSPELQAAGDTPVDAAIVFTDLHTSEDDYKKDTIEAIFGALKNTGLPFSSVISAGDAFSVNESDGSYTGETDTITGFILGALEKEIPVRYVWSDHDRFADIAVSSGLTYGAGEDGLYGTDDDDNYYVYELSMADTGTWDRYDTGLFYTDEEVTAHIAMFKRNAANLDPNKPLFIVSHQPLLDRRGDNGHAYEWAVAINEVADQMDVAYLYGHNHGYDKDEDYYYAKGTPIPVATSEVLGTDADTDSGMDLNSVEVTLNFPHICVGYMDPKIEADNVRKGTVMAITIYEDAIRYTTYDAEGAYVDDDDKYKLDVEIERAHANDVASTVTYTDPATGVSVTAPGLTGVVVTPTTVEYDTTVYECYHSYEIDPQGYTKGKVTVQIPLDEDHDPKKPVVVRCEGKRIDVVIVKDGMVTFTADKFPEVYSVAQPFAGLDWQNHCTHTHVGESYYVLAGKVESGKTYLIANKASTTANDNSNAIFVLAPEGSGFRSQTTYENGRIISDETAAEWIIESVSGGYTIRNEAGDYLYPDASRSWGWSYSLGIGKTANAVEITARTDSSFRFSRKVTSNSRNTTSYLRYSNSAFSASGTASNLYLFEKVEIPGNPMYSAIVGGTSFEFIKNVFTPNQIEAQIMDLIDVFIASDTSGNSLEHVTDYLLEGTIYVDTPGTYTLEIVHDGHNLGEIAVTIKEPEIKGYSVRPSEGSVVVGAEGDDLVGAYLILEAADDEIPDIEIPITLDMLRTASGDPISTDRSGNLHNLQIIYDGAVIEGLTFSLAIYDKRVNHYPEYPDEGAVNVHKSSVGIDFQNTGIAQVEISASGVPVKKGADVIVMLDTSSSMTKNNVLDENGRDTGKTRKAVLEESLADLIEYFRTPGEDGMIMDIRVAIADFNGYYGHNSNGISGTPYDRTNGDYVRDDNNGTGGGYAQPSEAQVYTNSTNALDATAFIPVQNLAEKYTLNDTSGTNYDYAFDAIYQLGFAIKAENEKNQEERDLYVIFMSDGASLQWNYFGTQNGFDKWNNWLGGHWEASDLTTTNLNSTAHAYFYDLVDHDGDGQLNEHRMANAIKGDPNERYEIIRKSTSGLPVVDSEDENGLFATGQEYMYTVPGLGASLFTINFDARKDGDITVENIDRALSSTASDQTGTTQYYYKVTSAELLDTAFRSISADINYAAVNARFVDQLGDDFNIQLKSVTYEMPKLDSSGKPVTDKNGDYVLEEKKIAPVIEILSYDIYTKSEKDAGLIPDEKKVGDRKGTYTLGEVVKFSDDGTKAYSNLIDVDKDGRFGVKVTKDASGSNVYTIDDPDDNIIDGNQIIWAKTFLYSNAITSVYIDGVDIPTGVNKNNTTYGSTNELPSETFYWRLGEVQSSELAMRYYVYLEGSMEGITGAGTYPTNEFATLYYLNYLGYPCYLDTHSPVMPWKEADVTYAFYLVNPEGKVVVNKDTGETGTFAYKIPVTQPIRYATMPLNSDSAVSIDVAALGTVPEGYQLYDPNTVYEVSVTSAGIGSSWSITGSSQTTYVMNFDPTDGSAYSNSKMVDSDRYDYTHTVVWFAVVWKLDALPDTVVIDYGQPVDISVLANDMFGDYGSLAGIGPFSEELNRNECGEKLADGFGNTYHGTYGTAISHPEISKICYTLNSMVMDSYEKFSYAVFYNGPLDPDGYYYDTVTVIPATTIYFEDSFLTYSSYERASTTTTTWTRLEESKWVDEGANAKNAQDPAALPHQNEDRPGKYSMTDANNIYGYDGVNNYMTTYSLGSSRKVTVDTLNRAEADFDFWGTGFDVISMTSNMTGNVKVSVEKMDENGQWQWFDGYTVNTYYGYKKVPCHVAYVWTESGWVRRGVLHEAEGCAACTIVTALPESAAKGDVVCLVEDDWIVNQNAGMKQVPGDADGDGTVEEGELIWVTDPEASTNLYQVPVIKMADKPYGHYRVNIKVTYNALFDQVAGSDSYDFYLDAIRIYDPTNDGAADGGEDTTIEDAYIADGEYAPDYIELRNLLIQSGSFGDNSDTETKLEGLVFIDGDESLGSAALADYVSYGPNNEVYIAPGQRVAFLLSSPEDAENVHIGIKSADGRQCYYTITNVAQGDRENGRVHRGDYYNARTYSMETGTDMYYNLTSWKNDIIVISNTGNRYGTKGVLSVTNLKITRKAEQTAGVSDADTEDLEERTTPYIYMTADAAELTVNALNKMGQQVQKPAEPDIFVPALFHVKLNRTEVTQGQKVLVRVTTSADVARVSINGVEVSTYTTGSTGNRTWKLMVEAERTGSLPIGVVCYNEFFTASKTVTQTVKVTSKGVTGWLSDLLT